MSPSATLERLRRWLDDDWSSDQRIGMRLILASCITTIVVAFLGPSTVALNVGPATSPLPPWFIPLDVGHRIGLPLTQWILVPVLWLSITAGAVGLWVCWRAVSAGWRPAIHRLFYLGVVLNLVTACVPPLTSADVLMYAAYGRLQRLGVDPYSIPPAEMYRQTYDPVLIWTEQPWQDTPSVYGPIASFTQYLANVLGGDSMHDVVFWLQMMCVIPFILICAIMIKLAHGNPARQARSVMLTILNPLLIWAVVAGAHNEAISLVFAICGLWFVRRSSFVTGLFIGLAGCVKVSLVFYGIAMAWGYRRDWRKLVGLAVGAAIPIVVGYGLLSPPGALFAAGRNTGYVSGGSWAMPLKAALDFIPSFPSSSVVGLLGWLLMLVLAWMLSRVVPWTAVPGATVPAKHDPLTITTRTALVLCAAWLVASPYTLPWYDLIAWVPLALLARNKLDWLLLVRGAALSVAYVTGRTVGFTAGMDVVTFVVRDIACSVVQIWVLVMIVRWWWTSGHELPTRRGLVDGLREMRPRGATHRGRKATAA
ncbi:putative hexosyltransferase [Nigerium massiliense]|uniref:hypothetical protein n=1 Tax=Nigerium massiliense TaxID=1522317 RepID=UPI00090777B3|nr:hypothetical protein [Nigerium massiliense]